MNTEITNCQENSNKRHKIKLLFLDNLEKSFGNFSFAAEITGISRKTIYEWMKSDESFKDKVEDAQIKGKQLQHDALVRVVEECAIVGKDWKAAIAILERRHKKDGWTTRSEITGADGGAVETNQIVQFYMPENNRDNNTEEN